MISDAALNDLASVFELLAKEDEQKAIRQVLRLIEAAERLAEFPSQGRPGRIPGTRELVISGTPYIVPYRIKREVIHILRFYHSSRRWPKRL